jgi:hypothetical protein
MGIGVNINMTSPKISKMILPDLSIWGRGFNTTQFCSGTTSGSLTYSSTVTQTGWMADVAEVGDLYGQAGNGQQVNVSFKYKKAAGLTGTLLCYVCII